MSTEKVSPKKFGDMVRAAHEGEDFLTYVEQFAKDAGMTLCRHGELLPVKGDRYDQDHLDVCLGCRLDYENDHGDEDDG